MSTAIARSLPLRLHRWWTARSLPFREVVVRERTQFEALIIEAFVGRLRVARLVAVFARELPDEAWTTELPKDHFLPTVWICECRVDGAFRLHGVGRRLVTRLAHMAFARHADALMVGCADSSQARLFASALGFNVRGETVYASLGGVGDRLLA